MVRVNWAARERESECLPRLTSHDIPHWAFQKHANSEVQKPPSQVRFSLPSIITTIRKQRTLKQEKHKTDRNPPITNHKPWPFELVKVNFCFLRGSLSWLTAAKNANVSWLLNFRIRVFMKSAVSREIVCTLLVRPLYASNSVSLLKRYLL